jgi:pimeloyl-ACP methyl ester carboxylesterase
MGVALIDGLRFEYEVVGDGEPLVLIHGSLIADSFDSLLSEPAIAENYRLITYHRRGYKGTEPGEETPSMARQGADVVALLNHLGIERAHILGHSYGGVVALSVALDAPQAVQSLSLLEPALILGEGGAAYRESFIHVQTEYQTGDYARIVDGMLRPRFGENYQTYLDRMLPGAFDDAVSGGLQAAVTRDMPALLDWPFGEAEAKRIEVPSLVVLGSESNALWSRFGETYEALLSWLPRAEGFVLPGATHALQIQNPRGMAEALSSFLQRHRIES